MSNFRTNCSRQVRLHEQTSKQHPFLQWTSTPPCPSGCWVSWETSLSTTQSGPYGCWVSWATSLSTTQSGPVYECWVSWETSLSTTQSGPYGCWVSWETSLSTTQSGPYGCWVSWETSLSTTQSGPYGCWVSWETSLSTTQSGPYGCWVSWETSLPPCLPHSQVLMGAGLAGRPPCLPPSQVLMSAGLAGRPPCLPHSQVLMGVGLAERPPCLLHSQVLLRFQWHYSSGYLPHTCQCQWHCLKLCHTKNDTATMNLDHKYYQCLSMHSLETRQLILISSCLQYTSSHKHAEQVFVYKVCGMKVIHIPVKITVYTFMLLRWMTVPWSITSFIFNIEHYSECHMRLDTVIGILPTDWLRNISDTNTCKLPSMGESRFGGLLNPRQWAWTQAINKIC